MIVSIVFGVLGLTDITFYTIYNRVRENLMIDIRNLLEDCRKLSSWDDIRSELKLISWIEGDERQLHKKSILELHRIRNNMAKYWQTHLEMDENEPYGAFQTEPQTFHRFLLYEILGLCKKHRRI